MGFEGNLKSFASGRPWHPAHLGGGDVGGCRGPRTWGGQGRGARGYHPGVIFYWLIGLQSMTLTCQENEAAGTDPWRRTWIFLSRMKNIFHKYHLVCLWWELRREEVWECCWEVENQVCGQLQFTFLTVPTCGRGEGWAAWVGEWDGKDGEGDVEEREGGEEGTESSVSSWKWKVKVNVESKSKKWKDKGGKLTSGKGGHCVIYVIHR